MSGFVDDKWSETTEVNPDNLNSASVPVGGIIMFSGTIADLTANWKLCDGTDGTPDLRGRFIVGAEGSYDQGDTGGADTVTLTTSQIPSHNHSGPSHSHGSGSLSTGSSGSHTHTQDLTTMSDETEIHRHQSTARASAAPSNVIDANLAVNSNNGEINSGGSHSHSVSGSTASSGTGNTGSTGSGNSHENRPPYYALAYIQRVA